MECENCASLERKIKFQEIQIRAQLDLIESIRNLLKLPAGSSILNALQPPEEPVKSILRTKRIDKVVSTEDRNYLKSILDYYNIDYCPKASTRKLAKRLDSNMDLLEEGSTHLEFLNKIIESLDSNL